MSRKMLLRRAAVKDCGLVFIDVNCGDYAT